MLGGVTNFVQHLLQIEEGTAAAGAGHVLDHGLAQSQGLQDRITDRDFFLRSFRQRHPQRVTQSIRQQRGDASRALDPAVITVSSFRHAQVQRIVEALPIHRVGHQAIGRQHHGSTRGLH